MKNNEPLKLIKCENTFLIEALFYMLAINVGEKLSLFQCLDSY